MADLERLVELAYSAAVEDFRWQEWTVELVKQFDAPGALFWVIDANHFDMCQNHMCFRGVDNQAVTQEYLSGPVNDDPQMARVCGQTHSEIYLDTDHVDIENERTSAYVDWQEAVVGSRHHITSSVVLDQGLQAGVSLHFTRQQGPPSFEVQRQMAELFPHFARALKLGFRHAEVISENWWDGLSTVGEEARILLAPQGKVLRANTAAEAILARGDGIGRSRDHLVCADTKSQDLLWSAIDKVCRSKDPRGSSVVVRRKSDLSPYLVSLYPLVQRRRFLAPFGATALVCIADPAAHHQSLSAPQMLMLRLTPREGELSRLLVNGHSLASASEVMGISYNTTRVHLSSLFTKTNTSRQSELMLFLRRLP